MEQILPNGKSIMSVKRDCAPQFNTYKVLNENRQWVDKNETVTDAYSAGCTKETEDLKATRAEYCYCETYLCNSSKSSHDSYSHHSDAMAVIFVFNAMKYLRSLR